MNLKRLKWKVLRLFGFKPGVDEIARLMCSEVVDFYGGDMRAVQLLKLENGRLEHRVYELEAQIRSTPNHAEEIAGLEKTTATLWEKVNNEADRHRKRVAELMDKNAELKKDLAGALAEVLELRKRLRRGRK